MQDMGLDQRAFSHTGCQMSDWTAGYSGWEYCNSYKKEPLIIFSSHYEMIRRSQWGQDEVTFMSQWVQKTVMVMSAGHSKFRSYAPVILKVLFSWQKYGSLLSEIPLKCLYVLQI